MGLHKISPYGLDIPLTHIQWTLHLPMLLVMYVFYEIAVLDSSFLLIAIFPRSLIANTLFIVRTRLLCIFPNLKIPVPCSLRYVLQKRILNWQWPYWLFAWWFLHLSKQLHHAPFLMIWKILLFKSFTSIASLHSREARVVCSWIWLVFCMSSLQIKY